MLLLAPTFTTAAVADSRIVIKPKAAKKFATMPEGAVFPEGIAVNPVNGEVIVSTFNFGANKLVRFSRKGKVLAVVEMFSGPLLGLAYNPADGKIYICAAADLLGSPPSRIQRIDADFTDDSSLVDVATVPPVGAPDDRTVVNPDGSEDTIAFGNFGRAPNDLTFASNGDLYYSDSFQGAVFRIPDAAACPGTGTCSTDTISHDPLLATAGFPPFGANGVAFNADESVLFVNNTGDDTVLTVDPFDGTVGVLAHSINGADGVIFHDGLLWGAANQGDQVVAIDPSDGSVVARIGAFLGVKDNGSVRGLIFPASLAIRGDDHILVTNLAFPLGSAAGEPEGSITTYTVSKIKIPDFDDD